MPLLKLPKHMTGFSPAGEELPVKKTKAGSFVDVPDDFVQVAVEHGLTAPEDGDAKDEA